MDQFPSDVLQDACINQTVDELTQLGQDMVVIPSSVNMLVIPSSEAVYQVSTQSVSTQPVYNETREITVTAGEVINSQREVTSIQSSDMNSDMLQNYAIQAGITEASSGSTLSQTTSGLSQNTSLNSGIIQQFVINTNNGTSLLQPSTGSSNTVQNFLISSGNSASSNVKPQIYVLSPGATTAIPYSDSSEINIKTDEEFREQVFTESFETNFVNNSDEPTKIIATSTTTSNKDAMDLYNEAFPNTDKSETNQANKDLNIDTDNNTDLNIQALKDFGVPNYTPALMNPVIDKTINQKQTMEFTVPLRIPVIARHLTLNSSITVPNQDQGNFEKSESQNTRDGIVNNTKEKAESTAHSMKDGDSEIMKLIEKERKGTKEEEIFDTSQDTSYSELNTTNDSYTETDFPPSDHENENNALERIAMEKFSENLGLIPADELKSISERLKTGSNKVRTRKSFNVGYQSDSVSGETGDEAAIAGHKHATGYFRCGSCGTTFTNICKLHMHLQEHSSGGSYHYDHMLKTAFPKYDTACQYTQTLLSLTTDYTMDIVANKTVDKSVPVIDTEKEIGEERSKSKRKKVTPFGKGISFKGNKSKDATVKTAPFVELDVDVPPKRKRGRPRKVDLSKNVYVDMSEKVSKLKIVKVKTDNGGDMWKEVKKELADTSTIEGDESPMIENITSIIHSDGENEEAKNSVINQVVDKYMAEIEEDIAELIDPDEKRSRKRKMSKPRKFDRIKITKEKREKSLNKIVNSRVKPECKIKCDFCDSMFHYTRGLIRHEQEKHPEMMTLQCDLCPLKFIREFNLERHKLCSHTVGKVKMLKQSKGIHKEKLKPGRKPRPNQSPEGPTACEVCGTTLPASKIDIHMRIHTGERPYICHCCGKGLISDKKLKRHLLIHSEIKRHTCEVCGEGFSMKYKLRTHMFIHTGHKPYLCSVCGAEFNNSTSLLHHHRTVHLGDKRFECNVCGGRYGKKSQLEEHMFSHSTERTQTCRYCGKTFKHAKSLRRHEFTHISDAKYPCDQCDSKFSRKDNLERHKMCHYESALQCRFCKKKFREIGPLEEHEQFHINQKKYQCQLCKEKFQEESYFFNHMENIHQLTKDMLPLVTAFTDSSINEDIKVPITTDLDPQNIVLGAMKIADSMANAERLSSDATQDTLNLSMNAAGIIPSSGQDLIQTSTESPLQIALVSQNSGVNPGYTSVNSSQSVFSVNARSLFNQSMDSFTVPASHLIPGISQQRSAGLGIISSPQGGTMRLPTDQTASLTSEVMLHEQQRLMQEALGASLNMPVQNFRLQNMFQ